MDKISPEEKIQWMKKILQKKESISSVASKIGVYYTTVDKWLRACLKNILSCSF
ncbi:hypothetical protein [Anaerobutyricum hallii]|uniref:hypothetical protein n=1 Tax=Anaerobutyricum hallii TaxID=39488 RepID=UPI00352120C7